MHPPISPNKPACGCTHHCKPLRARTLPYLLLPRARHMTCPHCSNQSNLLMPRILPFQHLLFSPHSSPSQTPSPETTSLMTSTSAPTQPLPHIWPRFPAPIPTLPPASMGQDVAKNTPQPRQTRLHQKCDLEMGFKDLRTDDTGGTSLGWSGGGELVQC